MKIAVIGAGNIGGTLGSRWAARGHDVVFVVRDPRSEKIVQLLKEKVQHGQAVSIEHFPEGAEAVLFAVPYRAMEATIGRTAAHLNGKILIDATNDISRDRMDSLDLLREAAPASSLFRAFSNLGWEVFEQPDFAGVSSDLIFCGSDGDGRASVERLIADTGLRPMYIGGLENSGIIDSLTRLYFALAHGRGFGRHVGVKILIGEK